MKVGIKSSGQDLLNELWKKAEENGGMIKLLSDTDGVMPLYAEIFGSEILGLPKTLVLTHYKNINGDSLCDPRMSFIPTVKGFAPVSWQNDHAGFNTTIANWDDEKNDWVVADPGAFIAAINFFNDVWLDNIVSFYKL